MTGKPAEKLTRAEQRMLNRQLLLSATLRDSKGVRCGLEQGADANATTPFLRDTALHPAAYFGDKETIELLLEHGAQVNAANKFGHTPLHKAAEAGNAPTVKLLLEYGADPNAKNKYGDAPAEIARKRGNTNLAELIEKYPLHKLLLRSAQPTESQGREYLVTPAVPGETPQGRLLRASSKPEKPPTRPGALRRFGQRVRRFFQRRW